MSAPPPAPARGRDRPRRWRRWLRLVGRALGALVVLLVLVVSWALYTDSGRATVLRVALDAVDDLIAGELQIDRLERIGPDGLACSGIRLLDPQGEQVASLDRLVVDLEPRGLLDSHVQLDSVRLDGLRVDLRHLDEQQRGLLAAVRTEPSEPDPAAEPSAWVVDVRGVELVAGELVATVAPWGEVTVRDLAASAGLHVGDAVVVELERLSLDLHDAEHRLVELREVEGRYRTDGQPSSLKLQLRGGGAELELRARAVAPPAKGWEREPLELEAELRSVGPELWRLARLEPPSQLGHPLGLALSVTGTPADLSGKVKLTSPGGDVEAKVRLEERDAASIALRTSDLDLRRIWSDLPATLLSADLDVHTRIADAPTELPVRVALRRGQLGELRLPDVDLTARIEGEQVRDVAIDAEGYGSELEVRGEAGFDGSVDAAVKLRVASLAEALRVAGGLDVRGRLRLAGQVQIEKSIVDASARADVRGLEVAELVMEKASLDVTVRGELPHPTVTLLLRTGHGRWQQTRLEPSSFRLSGGPEEYRLVVDAAVAGHRVALTADAALHEQSVTVSARGSGQLLGQPLRLDLRRAQVGFDGALQLGSLDLEALGQKLSAHGALRGRRDERLSLQSRNVDLAQLSRTFGLQPPVRGRVDLQVAVAGSVAQPRIELSGSARDVRLPPPAGARAGTLRGSWQATLDAQLGTLEGTVEIAAEQGDRPGPTVGLKLAGRFPPYGRFPQQLLAGEDYTARLTVDGVTTSYLEPWIGAELPVEGSLSAAVDLAGRLLQPVIELEARADLKHPESGEPLTIAVDGRHEAGRVTAVVDAADGEGEWARAELDLQAPDEPLPELLARAAELGDESSFTVRFRAAERELGGLPMVLDWPEEVGPLRLSAELEASHEPHAEPRVEGSVALRYPAQKPTPDDGPSRHLLHQRPTCRPRPFEARLDADLADGDLSVELRAGTETRRWVALAGAARLPLSPLLRGEAAELPRDVGVRFNLAGIHAAELPVLCESVVGSVSGHGAGRDLLGEQPRADLRLRLAGVGTRETLDGGVTVRLDQRDTRVSVDLRHGGRTNRIRAHLPLSLSRAQPVLERAGPVAVRVDLEGLPLAAVVPVQGPLSRLSGEVSGKAQVSGTLDDPELRGAIDLHDVGLTLTAMAQPLRRIGGRIAFEDDRLLVQNLVARDQGGSLTLHGEIDVGGLPERAALRFGLAADDFPVRQAGQVAATVDLAATIRAELEPDRTRAKVTLRDLDVWLESTQSRGISLEPHPDIIDPRAPEEEPEPAPPADRRTRLVLDMTEPFWIKRDDMAIRLAAKLDVRVDGDGARVKGEAEIRRGYLQLLGALFDIERGSSITFVEATPPDPVVDLSAKMDNRRSGQVIGVRISGRVSEPELVFSVDGAEVTAGEAVAAMFGEGSQDDGSSAEGQAKSMLAGVAGSMLALAARKELGAAAPIILLDPGEDAAHSRVRVGFDLDDLVPDFMSDLIRGVYIEGVVAGDEGTGRGVGGGVLLDLFLPASLVLTGQYGPGETWAVDFGWEP